MNPETNGHIRCAACRHATVDQKAGNKKWAAYECGNKHSEYHKALLNVTPKGDKLCGITWIGCGHGETGASV